MSSLGLKPERKPPEDKELGAADGKAEQSIDGVPVRLTSYG